MLGFMNSLCLELQFRYTIDGFLLKIAPLSSSSLRAIGEACIVYLKMTFASSRFGFTFRYWRSYWGPGAASAE